MDLANCPRCGKLFARHFRDICQNCHKELEAEYEVCIEYLRKNKGATITVLSDDTGVSIKQITRFIREGRISLYNAPNLSYPCEVCGVLIRDGNMCDNCRSRLRTEVRNMETDETRKARRANELRNGATYQIGDRMRERE